MKRKALSLLIILALLIPCAVCPAYADPTGDADALVGRWESVCDFSPLFISAVDTQITPGYSSISVNEIPSFDTIIDALPFSIFLEFHEDGTVTSGFVNMDFITDQLVFESAYSVENGRLIIESPALTMYQAWPPYYTSSADTLNLSFTNYMAVNDMDADDIEELYQNKDFALMFPIDYSSGDAFQYEMSWTEHINGIKASLLPFYDLTYTRA